MHRRRKTRSATGGAGSRRAQEIQEAKRAWQNELSKKTAGEGMTYDSVLKTLNELLTGKETLVTSGMTGDLLRNIDAIRP